MRLTVIGAGPGGYKTALDAAAKGIDVTLVSAGPVGGTCLNEGCIPTKSFCREAEVLETVRKAAVFGVEVSEPRFDIKSAVARKDAVVSQLRSGIDFLLEKQKVRVIRGTARFMDGRTVAVAPPEGGPEETVTSDYIIIATGSVSASLPVPGCDLDGVVTSARMLSPESVPPRLCIIGAGVIGLELASVYHSFGSDVTVLEYCKEILPRFDTDLAKRLKQSLSKRGIRIETSAQVREIAADGGDALAVVYEKKGEEVRCGADKVLMAVGRRPNVGGLDLEAAGVEYGPRGIVTDGNMRTNVPHIFAVGDVRGGMMLAHVAEFEGTRALNAILAERSGAVPSDGIRLDIVPAAVFTSPEAATVGLTEDECKAKGIPVHCLKSFFRANGKAVSMDETEGFCKVVAADAGGDYAEGQILGCHLFGAHSADIVQEIAALMNFNATVDDLKRIIHAHPTLSEVLLSVQ